MGAVGQSRRIDFWIADVDNNPVTNAALPPFSPQRLWVSSITGNPVMRLRQPFISISFERNNRPCADPLALFNKGGGAYFLEYTPSAPGLDAILIDDQVNDLHYRDIEEIQPFSSDVNVVTVTQDFGGAGALQPDYPNLSSYTLCAYLSSDWRQGNTGASFVQASYRLDANGNWTLSLMPDTYDFVLYGDSGSVIVFRTNVLVFHSAASTFGMPVQVEQANSVGSIPATIAQALVIE